MQGRFEDGWPDLSRAGGATSLNTLGLLPRLFPDRHPVGQDRGTPAQPAYVEQVTRVWRAAIDAYQANPEPIRVKAEWDAQLARVSGGSQTTLGAYHRQWQWGALFAEILLGPLLFYWPQADTPGLLSGGRRQPGRHRLSGETVCGKRRRTESG